MKANCGNCKFYLDSNKGSFKSGYGKCRRYPEHTPTNDGHWCGEHQDKQE